MTVLLGGERFFFFFLVVYILKIGCLQAQPAEQNFHDCEVRLPVEKCIFSQIVCLKDSQAALMNSEDHQHAVKHQNKSLKSQSSQGVESVYTYSLIARKRINVAQTLCVNLYRQSVIVVDRI